MSRDELRESFFLECEDLLEVLDTGLNEISNETNDPETINAVFRAVHSIKGGAGAFALDELVEFAHLFETVLDEVHSGRLEIDRDLINLFLRSSDTLCDIVAAARSGGKSDREVIDKVIEDLGAYVPGVEEEEEEEFVPLALDLDLDLALIDLSSPQRKFKIQLSPNREFYDRGNETTLLLRTLAELGEIEVACDSSEIPLLDEFDPEDGLCRWTVVLKTEASESDIAEIFEFAAEDCQLTITDETPETDKGPPGISDLPPPSDPSGDPETDQDLEPTADAERALDINASAASPVAEQSSAASETPTETKSEATPKPKAVGKPSGEVDQPRATIRVDLDRVDRLINLVGELVVNQAMITQTLSSGDKNAGSEIKDDLAEFKRLTRDIQESVISIRAQPVKPLFQRMARIVREAAQTTGKRVKLITDGQDTEVDKTVVERLADPLTHMIRNAVDHGLETPAKRQESGKDPEGIVRLSAAHKSGRVVIEISDDGAGIDRERVRQIAIDKDLISADTNLTDGEIDNLLFLPGFSTAKEVSNLSGRGVGMDVVRKSIQSLGGRIVIASQPGHGTSLTISLPLTLAVLDGIVVGIAGETFIVPLSSVIETLKPRHDEVFRLDTTSWALYSRGQVIPVVDVGHELGMRARAERLDEKVVLVAGNEDGNRNALIVDTVEDQRQVVIKSLEKNYGEVRGIAAATILGDGRIGLILDVDVLVQGATSVGAGRAGSMAMAG